MIRSIPSWTPFEPFLHQYLRETPKLMDEGRLFSKLAKAFGREGERCFAALDGEEAAGLFAFDPLEEDYFVTDLWLTRSEAAAREMMTYLQREYGGYGMEFTFSPRDMLLRKLLAEVGATVFPEQRNMERNGPVPSVDTTGIAPIAKVCEPAYYALHRESDPEGENYWTGEMVAADGEGFSVLLAMADGVPVGFLDLGLGEEGNNVSDLFVLSAHRRKGWGRKLLTKAIELTGAKQLTLQVDVDNGPALALYEGMGFRFKPEDSWMDAIWRIQG
ncbi:MAG: GNAT family N-acetyltransferase [Clostridia bacterium]|nr:GNAT family N-acetyltransferase [Clostridia bacterium]MBQ3652166.1 GNAT family N-acetyltransferase [Clostridia bacterium]MBR0422244.1 GNAT family N-acetyltransferase [Clostridia bacterium]